MPPAPKHPSTRARNNRTSTNAILHPVDNPKVPQLPRHRQWSQETRTWWKSVWSSPMSSEYDVDSDYHALLRLAMLVDEFHKAVAFGEGAGKILGMSAEIRLQEQRFGLSPMDRRRLQWTIEQGESAEKKTEARRKATAPKVELSVVEDPREMLA